jgi:hypothetical protein
MIKVADLDDDRIRQLLREELDFREKEAQDRCSHSRSGFIMNGAVRCDDCSKIMGEYELDNAYCGQTPPLSKAEKLHVGRM